MKKNTSIAVLGTGSWGTALAIHLARNGRSVSLWGRNPAQLQAIEQQRCNAHYLPGMSLPDLVKIEPDFARAINQTQQLLIAVPSHGFHSLLDQLKPLSSFKSGIVWATKGLDSNTHSLLHQSVVENFPDAPYAILSGPSFAKEVAMNLPTAVTIAASTSKFARDLSTIFHSKTFRVYTSHDVIGVELAGAMKNVLAIAVGIADGLQLGANTRSAIITRGLHEIVRLGRVLGGKPATFMGLAGVGDLVLTCTDNQSRNRRFGLALGSGKTKAMAENEIGQVVEGIGTAAEIHLLAQKNNVETPITEQIYKVIYEGLSPIQAVDNLLSRKPKKERI